MVGFGVDNAIVWLLLIVVVVGGPPAAQRRNEALFGPFAAAVDQRCGSLEPGTITGPRRLRATRWHK